MAQFAPTGPAAPSVVSTRSKTTPTIQNVTLVAAATEYSITIPTASVAFSIRTRGCSKCQFAFTSGDSGTNYITLWPGETYNEEGLTSNASITIYIQTPKAGEILEVWSWT